MTDFFNEQKIKFIILKYQSKFIFTDNSKVCNSFFNFIFYMFTILKYLSVLFKKDSSGKLLQILSLPKEIARNNSSYYLQQMLGNISRTKRSSRNFEIPDSKSLLKYRLIFGNYIATASKWKTLFVISCGTFV